MSAGVQIFWLLIVTIVPASIMAIIYRSRLQRIAGNTVSLHSFNEMSHTSKIQLHDLRALSTSNADLHRQLDTLRDQYAEVESQADQMREKLQASILAAEIQRGENISLVKSQRQSVDELTCTSQQLAQARLAHEATEIARDRLLAELQDSNIRVCSLQSQLEEEQKRAEAKLEETTTAASRQQQCHGDALAELQSQREEEQKRAEILHDDNILLIDSQRQLADALTVTRQQLAEIRLAHEASQTARDRLLAELAESNTRVCNLEGRLEEEQKRAEAKLEETTTAASRQQQCHSDGLADLQSQREEEQQHAAAKLEEAAHAAQDQQQCHRDVLAELLFLQHFFGEAGVVARDYWRSTVSQDSAKEPFEREADVTLSAHPARWALNGESRNHVAAQG